MTWAELFPEGRWIYYEGDDFEAFAKEMVKKYGFDPRKTCSFHFECPPELLDEVYGGGKYPLGS